VQFNRQKKIDKMLKMDVSLVQVTHDAEATMAYIARVSNPTGQVKNENFTRLLRYCIIHEHWSVFEHAHMTLKIDTTCAIATQLLRHRSFTFQQFSQRYANPTNINTIAMHTPQLRMQDTKNRQNSTDDCPAHIINSFQTRIETHFKEALDLYTDMINVGIAKECARFVLPQSTNTSVYMTGNCRSWIHYIQLRTNEETQKEHRDVALAVKAEFCKVFPIVASALNWID